MTIQQANEFIQSCVAEHTPQILVEKAFDALGCAKKELQYVPVAGTVGKSCVVNLQASILSAAGFSPVGAWVGGMLPLRERILIDGKPVPAKVYTAAVAAVQRMVSSGEFSQGFAGGSVQKNGADAASTLDEAELVAAEFGFTPMQAIAPQEEAVCSVAAVEFLVATLCFAKSDCKFAVVELAEPSYAAMLTSVTACAITQIGGVFQREQQVAIAKSACAMLRNHVAVVTAPTQLEEVVAVLKAASKKAGCALTVPELDDFTEKKHRRLQNRMDYGGYEVILPYLGVYATYNAAIAIELSLAIWRKGFDISDDAILQGLSMAENQASLSPVQYTPAVVVDGCHTPLQAAAFAQWVEAESYQAMSLILGFTEGTPIEAFLSALETGTMVDPDNPQKEQLPGMADNAFDKVYAVTPNCDDAILATETVAQGRFHFDIVACDSLSAAIAQAQADANEGIAICGCEAIARAAKKLFH